ncbi:MAG: DUF4173 domain-containing protein [Nitriliruptorales bacterium]|nr:DUF4173 domain-containing protein [Nitriliruptorales bacterium]
MTTEDSVLPAPVAADSPPRPSRQVAVPATPQVVLVSLLGGVVFDLAVRSGIVGVGGALAVVIMAAGLVVAGRPANRQAWALSAAAPLFGVWLAVRTSPWLVPLDIMAALGLLLLASSLARGGSVTDLGFGQAFARGSHAAWHLAAGPAYLRGVAGGRDRSVLIGLALAVPVVTTLGLLLGSADVVFASFVDSTSVPTHALLLAAGIWGAAGLLRLARAKPADQPGSPRRWLGGIEGLILLGAVSAVLVAFAAAQLIALSEGGQRVIETAGLTYAEYARSGFFQLLAVAALNVALLLAVRAWVRPETDTMSRWVLISSEVTVMLTLSLVVVAFRRLSLYIEAFDLTMLRLFVGFFTVWIGVVLLLIAGYLAGLWRGRAWFGPACGASGLLILLALNVMNPEAVVARYNLDRLDARTAERPTTRTPHFDLLYTAQLTDDAVPAIAETLADLPEASTERQALVSHLCEPRTDPPFHGWAAFNLARSRARQALATVCYG